MSTETEGVYLMMSYHKNSTTAGEDCRGMFELKMLYQRLSFSEFSTVKVADDGWYVRPGRNVVQICSSAILDENVQFWGAQVWLYFKAELREQIERELREAGVEFSVSYTKFSFHEQMEEKRQYYRITN